MWNDNINCFLEIEAIAQRCSVVTVFLELSQIHRKSPVPKYLFVKKENMVQVFSFAFCEISKNTFSYKTTPVAASVEIVL